MEKECKHEWIRPLADLDPNQYFVIKCVKCGLNAVEYLCKNCGERTPHIYVKEVGSAESHADFINVGYLEKWQCLKCGKLKTIRKGGHFARFR